MINYAQCIIGWLIKRLFSSMVTLISLPYVYLWGYQTIPLLPIVAITLIMVFAALLFFNIRIRIEQDGIHLIIRIVILRKTIRTEQVEPLIDLKTHWNFGLGLLIMPKSTLYNMNGLKAVMAEYSGRKGKRFLIGLTEMEKLREFLTCKYPADLSDLIDIQEINR